MPIPESQLDTWSHQGSIQQSSDTYQTIRRALLADDSGYADQSFDVFLQGSYGNDTNIYAESDVDVVMRLDSIYRHDLDQLSDEEKQAFMAYREPATYSFETFKTAVVAQLQRRFGAAAVSIGNKAIRIKADGSRRSADVVVCYQYRKYKSFRTYKTDDYVAGIIFPTTSGEIINYPQKHSANLTSQHQASRAMLKPMVRILKNMRSRMVDLAMIKSGVAPSYYLEGMFYNVPPEQYVSTSYGDTFCNGINWLLKADKKKLVCANRQYTLLGNSTVQWNETDFDASLAALCKLWKEWYE
jgi:hypothetical protein